MRIFLGLSNMTRHEYFIANIQEIGKQIGTTNIYSILTAVICLITIIMTPKFFSKGSRGIGRDCCLHSCGDFLFFQDKWLRLPQPMVKYLIHYPIFALPTMTFERLQQLIGPAFVIAMLGGIESLLSAVVADGMTNSKHNSNRELIGQGIANIVTPMFGGIPATGAIARTATNIKTGAVSPMSGIIHGVFVLLTLLLLAPYASHIPLASMAPVLMVVAWNMSERKHFFSYYKVEIWRFACFINYLFINRIY
ncbi:SulP family inorganic anion transporter [Lysinibacillus sp. MHQ-1]|nr:SulP family inorganic anion transporter [Lysinibacillus sp. MHQ-1]